MSLKVHKIKRKLLAGPEAGSEKYYGQVRTVERVPLKELVRRVTEGTSATGADVQTVINGLVSVMCFNLESGNTVELEDFGNFRLSAGSAGAATEKDFTLRMMRSPRVIFTPGEMLNGMMEEVTFDWLPVTIREGEVDCEEAHV